MKRSFLVAVLIAACTLALDCGQKGPLHRPVPPATDTNTLP